MMTALATVVSAHKTDSGYSIELSCDQQTSCSHCASQKSCGTGIISKAVGNKSHLWVVHSEHEIKAGKMVEIGLPEKRLIQFASIVYILPLIMLIIGAVIGDQLLAPLLNGGEGGTILLSMLFMGAGVIAAKYLATRLKGETEQSVKLLRVLGDTIDIAAK